MNDKLDHPYDADERGFFGDFGGRFMPEALVAALDELTEAWREAMADPGFVEEFRLILREYAGVPSPLYLAERLSEQVGATILLKREDLNHTGAHKIRNVLGQALLTRRMGKTRVIAETGAGQHGVASATAAAYFGMDCTVYMGSVDVKRQALNVARMQLLGAHVVPVDSGSATLKDAINEALRDWVASVDHTAYLFGTAAGPAPVPQHGPRLRPRHRRRGPRAVPRALRPAARRGRRVRRRRLQRDRALPGVPRRRRRDLGLRARRRRGRDRPARRDHPRRRQRGAARRAHVRAPGRGRPDHRVPLDLRGAGLPRGRAAARPPGADRPGVVPPRHRRGGHGRARPAEPHRGHHPGHRVGARGGRGDPVRAGAGRREGARRDRAHQPQRPRRQGHGDRDRVVRPRRRRPGTGDPA